MRNENFRKGLKRFLVVISMTGLLAIDLPAQGKTYKLFFAPKKGEVLKYDYQFALRRIREVAGRKSEINRSVAAVIDYGVEEVDPEGNIWVSLMYDALKMESLNPQGSSPAATQKSLGIPVRYLLDPIGRILKTKGLEGLPDIPDYNTKGDYDLMALLIQLPGREIGIGETWTGEWAWITSSASSSQTNAFTTTYKILEEVQRNGLNCLRIETATKEKIEGRMVMGGRDAVSSGDIDLKGEIFYAYREGILVEKSYVEDGGKLTITLAGPTPTIMSFTNFGRARYVLMR